MGIISFLEKNMLSCQWKKMGMECPGCGIQRAIILILKGEFTEAFYMYPAIYTLIILFAFLGLHLIFSFKNGHKILLSLFILNLVIIIINFIIRIY